jgi:hypothetical protein
MNHLRVFGAIGASAIVVACGGQLAFVGKDEQPTPPSMQPPAAKHSHNDSTIELPSDIEIVEPSQPAVGTPQERALAHVHTPDGVCSGVVLSPRVVVTAHQCIAGANGARAVAPSTAFYVEVASSTMTWTRRTVTHVVTGSCEWHKLDIAALVVSEPIEWVVPLRVTTAPPPGATLQALGFGRCAGETRGLSNRTGELLSREGDAIVLDVPLCRGDVGGPVVDSGAQVLGLVSHQDDPDNAARHTTTIVRLDTTPARAVVAQAHTFADKGDGAPRDAVACE